MKACLTAALICLATGARAEGFVSDGFGLVPADALSPERAAWAGLRSGPGSRAVVAPQRPETVLIFVGPKSLVAGRDDGQAVALVLDTDGNLVRDGIPADFSLGDKRMNDPATRHGIAEVRFRPEPVAGQFAAGARVEGRQSTRAGFRVAADLSSVVPEMAAPEAPLEPETVTSLATDRLADRFGNVVEDGAGATMHLTHADGSVTVLTPVVLDGRAEADILTRDLPGGGSLAAMLGAAVSRAVPVGFGPLGSVAPSLVDVRTVPEIGAVSLRVGPVLTDAGYLLNDGAPVRVEVVGTSGKGVAAEGWILDGYFEALLHLDAAEGPFTVTLTTALGTETLRAEVSATVSPLPRNAEK